MRTEFHLVLLGAAVIDAVVPSRRRAGPPAGPGLGGTRTPGGGPGGGPGAPGVSARRRLS